MLSVTYIFDNTTFKFQTSKAAERVSSTDVFYGSTFIYSLEYPCNQLLFEMHKTLTHNLEEEQETSIYSLDYEAKKSIPFQVPIHSCS